MLCLVTLVKKKKNWLLRNPYLRQDLCSALLTFGYFIEIRLIPRCLYLKSPLENFLSQQQETATWLIVPSFAGIGREKTQGIVDLPVRVNISISSLEFMMERDILGFLTHLCFPCLSSSGEETNALGFLDRWVFPMAMCPELSGWLSLADTPWLGSSHMLRFAHISCCARFWGAFVKGIFFP